ncbi:short-chain fatty acyl-CoA regulator family protein [Neomesorhizobium albiziae]|uniref:short-chain fatty acyl-CoA regulator family protein n=1 Tax=Neomesorhizobium albiziae TaxID=335020 RepID=UPI00122C6799|nr:short-chain fatty acyl-CoA regulator family protein [Mesorhizobium albiziae]GLS31019.1 hypothetical protein GCM10007937_27280 [Mesorhizobium albiziae]
MRNATFLRRALQGRGLTRANGVCNFNLPMIRQAVAEIGAPIASVQVDYHPFLLQMQAVRRTTSFEKRCRICARPDCAHRSFPPLTHRISVVRYRRDAVPYQIT